MLDILIPSRSRSRSATVPSKDAYLSRARETLVTHIFHLDAGARSVIGAFFLRHTASWLLTALVA
jgi:hypothetical protein